MDEQFYKTILDNLYDGVYFVDPDRRITYWNRGAERITGFTADEVVGKSCADNLLMHIDGLGGQLCVGECPLSLTMKDGQMREADVYLHHKGGHRIPVSVRIAPILGPLGQISGAVEIFSDASHKQEMLQELDVLQRASLLDALTGVGNRRLAEREFDRRIRELRSFGTPLGLLFLDIDGFKDVNDTHGHDAGDLVLAMVARSVASALRGADRVCRWGGDEFLVLMPGVEAETFKGIAERVRKLVEASQLSLPCALQPLRVTVSVGGCFATADDTLESLVTRADALMYQAKNAGRNCAVIG